MIVLRSFSSSCSNFWFIEKTKAEKMCCHCAQIGIRSVCAIFSVPLCHAYFLSGPYHQMQLRRYFFSSSHFVKALFVLLPSHLGRGQGGFSPPSIFILSTKTSALLTNTQYQGLDPLFLTVSLNLHAECGTPIISEVLEPICAQGSGPLKGPCQVKKLFYGLRL